MNAHPKKTWILPDDLAEAVRRLIDSGEADDFEHIVQAGIVALSEEPDPELEEWIERKVVPVIKEMERHPERAIPAEEVWTRLKAHHARRLAED